MKKDSKISGHNEEKLPLKRALTWIVLSVLMISGSAALSLAYFSMVSRAHKHDPSYEIVAIVQTSPDPQTLRTGYLAELLNLSIDKPTNLYAFNSKEATEKLLCCPVIKSATIRKIRPGTIHVDYTLRNPIGYLGDYANAAIDEEGVVFPFNPFYTPKNLPEIYLGLDLDEERQSQIQTRPSELETSTQGVKPNEKDKFSKAVAIKNGNFQLETGIHVNHIKSPMIWGHMIRGKRIELAFALQRLVQRECCDETTSLLRIDLSKAYAQSYGQRQIVLEFEERSQKIVKGEILVESYQRIVRLAPDNYEQQLANYAVLRNHLRQKPGNYVIDLRLLDLAFISQ